MMENNQLHKYDDNKTLYNVAMESFPLSSRILIWTSPVFFAVEKCPYATFLYLSVSTSNPGMKTEISGVMWQVAPESKI